MTKKQATLREAIKEAKKIDLQRKRDLQLIRFGFWMFLYFLICFGILFILTPLIMRF